MEFIAKSRYVRLSPTKLRLLADVVRGKNVTYALNWLETYPVQRAVPLRKVIASAVANAKDRNNATPNDLRIKEIRVDEGPMHSYIKPGAMGRSNAYRKRTSHISVVLEQAS